MSTKPLIKVESFWVLVIIMMVFLGLTGLFTVRSLVLALQTVQKIDPQIGQSLPTFDLEKLKQAYESVSGK